MISPASAHGHRIFFREVIVKNVKGGYNFGVRKGLRFYKEGGGGVIGILLANISFTLAFRGVFSHLLASFGGKMGAFFVCFLLEKCLKISVLGKSVKFVLNVFLTLRNYFLHAFFSPGILGNKVGFFSLLGEKRVFSPCFEV